MTTGSLPEIEGYDLLRELGRGAMGVVYLGRDRMLDREVAVKFITETGAPQATERFLREARAMARLAHPNVVTVFRAGVVNGEPYLVMELLRGRSLEDALVKEGPLSPARLLDVALGAARGLAAAHARGIVHRDIKPSNLFETEEGTIKVLDFGIAKLLPAVTPAAGSVPPSSQNPAPGEQSSTGASMSSSPSSSPSASSSGPVQNAHGPVAETAAYGPGITAGPVDPMERTGAAMPPIDAMAATRSASSSDGAGKSDEATTLTGTPLYMAPEVWREEGADHASDVWSLGAALYMLATGGAPFPGRNVPEIAFKVMTATPAPGLATKRGDLSPALCAAVDRCLAKASARRFASANELLAELDRVARENRGGVTRLEGSPYPGLRSMNEADRERFFGREDDAARVVERLRSDPCVVLVGPSGTGKSSLAAAGVAPAVAEGALVDPPAWRVLRVAPGRAPLAVLAGALAPLLPEEDPAWGALRTPESLGEAMRESPDVLARALRSIGARDGRGVLLLIDQLEELVTLAQGDERDAAAASLGRLIELAPRGVRVLATARSDLFDRLGALGVLGALLGRATELVRPLSGAALREAIVQPARAAGATFEDETLVDEILADVGAGEAALPLVAFAMSAWWDRRDREKSVLTREGWRAVGGVNGALGAHAEAVFHSLAAGDQQQARKVLLRLVSADGTRRYATRAELAALLDDDTALDRVLEAMGRARLLNVEGAGLEANVTVMHEALARAWPRLGTWISEGREDRALHERIKQASQVWIASSRSRDLLWRGAMLEEVARWRAVYDDLLAPEERTFLETSARVDRTSRRAFYALTAVVVLGLGGLSFGMFRRATAAEALASNIQGRAQRFAQGVRAEAAGRATETARALRDEDPAVALAWLAHAARLQGETVSHATRVLALGLSARGVAARYACTAAVAWRADGRRAACAEGSMLRVFDLDGGGLGAIDTINGVRSVALSDGDDTVAWIDTNGTLKISDPARGTRRAATEVRGWPSLSVAPDGSTVAWLERNTGRLLAGTPTSSEQAEAPSAAGPNGEPQRGRVICSHAIPEGEAARATLWHSGNAVSVLVPAPGEPEADGANAGGRATLYRFATQSAGGDDAPPTHRFSMRAWARRGPSFAWVGDDDVVHQMDLSAGTAAPCSVAITGEIARPTAPSTATPSAIPTAAVDAGSRAPHAWQDSVQLSLSADDGRVAWLLPEGPSHGVGRAFWALMPDPACRASSVAVPDGARRFAWIPDRQLGVWGAQTPLWVFDLRTAAASMRTVRTPGGALGRDAPAVAATTEAVLLAGDEREARAISLGSATFTDALGLEDSPVRAAAFDGTGTRALVVDASQRLFWYRAWPPAVEGLSRWHDDAEPAPTTAATSSHDGTRLEVQTDGRLVVAAPGHGAAVVSFEERRVRVGQRRVALDATAVAVRDGRALLGLRDGSGVLVDLAGDEGERSGTLTRANAAPAAVAIGIGPRLLAAAATDGNATLRLNDASWTERPFRPFSELTNVTSLALGETALAVSARWLGFVNSAGTTTLAREPTAFAEHRVRWSEFSGEGALALTTDDCSAWLATCTPSDCTVTRLMAPGEACAATWVGDDALLTAAPGRGVRLYRLSLGTAGAVLPEGPIAGLDARYGDAAALSVNAGSLALAGPAHRPFLARVGLPPDAPAEFDAWVTARTNLRIDEHGRVASGAPAPALRPGTRRAREER